MTAARIPGRRSTKPGSGILPVIGTRMIETGCVQQ